MPGTGRRASTRDLPNAILLAWWLSSTSSSGARPVRSQGDRPQARQKTGPRTAGWRRSGRWSAAASPPELRSTAVPRPSPGSSRSRPAPCPAPPTYFEVPVPCLCACSLPSVRPRTSSGSGRARILVAPSAHGPTKTPLGRVPLCSVRGTGQNRLQDRVSTSARGCPWLAASSGQRGLGRHVRVILGGRYLADSLSSRACICDLGTPSLSILLILCSPRDTVISPSFPGHGTRKVDAPGA